MSARLTDKEQQVATLLAEGVTVPAIAERLFMSPHTVRFHIRIISAKIPGEGKPLVRILRWYYGRAA